ncbi:hypothetical protein LOTGIDRAFT_229061 [Lottia gigantea]|uniref:Uncharacterized protein n=1 Tax=Lottia gigantea TaxID=225164 RepID=V4A781_LOTGI|nr:hypothetical protein LOTGIDRAFT_229061 [Lottia gigantea]ESO89146.1 hypothetical protein LOTGIDRAFT_229061 [Lottia gigantea]
MQKAITRCLTIVRIFPSRCFWWDNIHRTYGPVNKTFPYSNLALQFNCQRSFFTKGAAPASKKDSPEKTPLRVKNNSPKKTDSPVKNDIDSPIKVRSKKKSRVIESDEEEENEVNLDENTKSEEIKTEKEMKPNDSVKDKKDDAVKSTPKAKDKSEVNTIKEEEASPLKSPGGFPIRKTARKSMGMGSAVKRKSLADSSPKASDIQSPAKRRKSETPVQSECLEDKDDLGIKPLPCDDVEMKEDIKEDEEVKKIKDEEEIDEKPKKSQKTKKTPDSKKTKSSKSSESKNKPVHDFFSPKVKKEVKKEQITPESKKKSPKKEPKSPEKIKKEDKAEKITKDIKNETTDEVDRLCISKILPQMEIEREQTNVKANFPHSTLHDFAHLH